MRLNFHILIASLGVFLILLLPSFVYAQKTKSVPKTVILNTNQTVNQDYFAWGNNVLVSGTINGDAYIGGGNIDFDGVVNGDLLVAGGNINLHGKVTGNIRALGGEVVIASQVNRNVSVMGGSVEVSDPGNIEGSLTGLMGNLVIYGPIGKDINAVSGTTTLGNSVGGNTLVVSNELKLTSNTKLAGDLTYWSDNTAVVNQGAQINGRTNQYYPQKENTAAEKFSQIYSQFNYFWIIISFISTLLVGLLLIRFFPSFIQETADLINRRSFFSLLIGLLTLILTPVLIIILLVSLVGLPIGVILLVSFMILLYLSKIFISIAIGQRVLNYANQKNRNSFSLVIGMIVLVLISLVPFFGWFISFIATLIGLGGVVITKRKYYLNLSSKKQI